MPSKCFEAMAAGVPIMLSVRGEMAEHINRAGCGFTAEPDNLDQITAAFERFLALDESIRKEMGGKGRAYVVEHFSREEIAKNLERLMRETASHAG
jgi:glycosyltransferase involved in cell wall biosynthesis